MQTPTASRHTLCKHITSQTPNLIPRKPRKHLITKDPPQKERNTPICQTKLGYVEKSLGSWKAPNPHSSQGKMLVSLIKSGYINPQVQTNSEIWNTVFDIKVVKNRDRHTFITCCKEVAQALGIVSYSDVPSSHATTAQPLIMNVQSSDKNYSLSVLLCTDIPGDEVPPLLSVSVCVP